MKDGNSSNGDPPSQPACSPQMSGISRRFADSYSSGQQDFGATYGAAHLSSPAVSYANQHRRRGGPRGLEAELQRRQKAVDHTPEGHPNEAQNLQRLANSYMERYQRPGDPEDLETALQHDQQAVIFTSEGHLDTARPLQHDQKAVVLTPDGHPDKAERLWGLSYSCTAQYQRLGDLAHLEAALHYDQEILKVIPNGHYEKARDLRKLAIDYLDRYRKLGDLKDLEPKDLEGALQYNQEAVDLTP
ncbi:hypothetical protein DFH07DRAFT_768314 [Mycena maculata]|uniref:TPR-like protein n=1 Tax=Mycena maculata TaxID=230809 RepID=A0AAD7JTB2_9AGAR|nr:hypothetical protein DFH07DRAFT_768314 [Mycena maculata]